MEIKRKIVSVVLCLIMMLGCINVNVIDAKATGTFDITTEQNTDGYGSVKLDWKSYNYSNKNFKVYKSSNNGSSYESVGIDYTSVKEVKCLQIYPWTEANGQLKKWMETNGYGKGIIKINSCSLDNFNSNPNAYLKDSNGNWKYNVIFFGTWDANNYKDLSTAGRDATNAFIKAGGGAIFGHDTILNNTLSHPNFNALASSVGIRLVDGTTDMNADTKVIIKKKSLFTNYPWNIGDVGTVLTIPSAHTLGQVVSDGTSYLEFSNGGSINANNVKAPSYLTVKNNCALIMTGHSNGVATTDEQKIIANLIFYLNQLLFNTYTTNDNSAQDMKSPNKPSIKVEGTNYKFEATDNGSSYKYYVESYDKNNTTSTGLIARSKVQSITVTTGVKSYRYIYDDNADTTVTKSNGTEVKTDTIPYSNDKIYLHVAAVDGAGNISATTTVVSKYKNVYDHWAWGFKNNEGNNGAKNALRLQITYGEETYGKEFTPDASYGLTVPNGFYLAPRFGNGQITGKWQTFNFGTKITQPSYVMNFEYDYFPTDYTITYNLDGGTNSSDNPDSYTILYGVKFADPSKKGYDFLGWYDANGNKLTGINEGCYATFADTEDLYNRLNKRTTGDISVTA